MKKNSMGKLLFIYNANSGTRNSILASVHKIVNPKTYNCNLCTVTFGLLKENTLWKQFREDSGYTMIFLHKDEFLTSYKSKFGYKFSFPIVLFENGDGLELFITTEEINQMKNSKDLIALVKNRIK